MGELLSRRFVIVRSSIIRVVLFGQHWLRTECTAELARSLLGQWWRKGKMDSHGPADGEMAAVFGEWRCIRSVSTTPKDPG